MARPATAAVRLLTGEREPVRLATTGNISPYGLQAIDGMLTDVGDRVLVKNQTDARENGIYTASEGAWYRAADARTSRTMQKGTTVHVSEGFTNAGKTFVFNTLNPVISDSVISVGFYISDSAITDAQTAATNAATSATTAVGSAGSAAASATNAATSATSAGNSAAAASGSASSASTSAVSAGTSATAAAGSATTAGTSATNAGNSATAAANSATAAAASASVVNLPTPAANTFLVRNAGNTAYDPKTLPDVRKLLATAPYANTRTALKALDTTKDTVAILDGSLWFWTVGNFSTQVTADTAEGVYVKATAIASSSGAWVRVFTSHVTPEWFGAIGNGTTDDATALQASMDFALKYGLILQLGPKTYKSGTMLTVSSVTVASGNRLTIRGCGQYKTIIQGAHTGSVLRIGSSTGTAFSGYVALEDFGIESFPGFTPDKGIEMFDLVRSTANRVRASGCSAGVYLNGGISLLFDDCYFDGNVQGFVATNFTSLAGGGIPNFLSLRNCKIINNTTRGANFSAGTFLFLDGCDVEGNGTTGQVGHCGVQVFTNIGFLGANPYAFGATIRNCWFEANAGAASIAFLSGTNAVEDCYFVANTGASYDIYIGGGSYRIDGTQHDSVRVAHIVDVGTTTSNNYINNSRQGDGSRASIQVTPSRAYMPDLGFPVSTQERVLLADFTGMNVSTAQPVFSSPASLTLDAATTYEFEAEYFIIRTAGTTSHAVGTLFGGTATFNAFRYLAEVINPTGNVLTNIQAIRSDAASLVTLTAANTSATENLIIRLKGRLRTNAAGTLIPQFQFSAAPGGAPTVLANSAIRVWAVGSNQVAAVGPWS